jgi:diaminopimelate epimerase
MTVDAEKWHGTGNDFVVVDAEQYVPDRAAFASTHCDREEGVAPHGPGAAPADGPETAPADGRAGDESGVAQADGGAGVRPGAASAERSSPDAGADHRPGADGVLFLALEPDYRPPRAVMTLVQPDGSTAPMCGNGARVAAAWAAERTGADRVMLDTQAGTRLAQVERGADESATDGSRVTVEMGHPSFAPGDVPMDREEPLIDEQLAGLPVTAVDTGVPHAVAFVPDVEAVDLDAVAARSATTTCSPGVST